MYCHEAFRCDRVDCPVRRNRIKRCWTFFGESGTSNLDDCPYAPCSTCHYRMGWDIGLIGESMFPPDAPPGPADLLPPASLPDAPPPSPAPAPPPTPEPAPPAPVTRAPESAPPPGPPLEPAPEAAPPIQPLADALPEATGKPGMRFCWEVMECPNPRCPVRERRIIRCFKFFEPRGTAGKLAITCGDRTCDKCHYRDGWDMGIITEELFEDILAEKRLKLARADRIKRQTLVELYLDELSKKPLSRQEEVALARKLAGDRDASELLLTANLKLVVRIANGFTERGLSLMDLVQEGNIGLIRAISKFDYTLGYRFSTYAAYWIRYYMQKAVSEQGRVVRVPHHLLAVAHKIRRKIREMEAELFRAPTLRELAQVLDLEEDRILEIIQVTQTPISLEAGKPDASEDEESAPEYFIADRTALSPEEVAMEQAKTEACRKAIALLPERQREVVESFYGFRDEVLSLAEIGRRMGITRERARQILKEALDALGEKEFVANLKDFLV